MRTLAILFVVAGTCLAQGGPDVKELARADNAFACDLYQALRRSESGNLFYSPHSISSALVMTWAGARGETATEMARTLKIEGLGDSVHARMSALDRELARREKVEVPEDGGDPFRLRVSNALWGQVGYEFRREFLELLAEHYGAGLRSLDFQKDADGSRRTINAAIEEETEERIKDLLEPSDVPPSTRLVLTNAIYFKASWSETFEERWTQDATFHRLDGSTVDVPLMRRSDHFGYHAEEGLEAIELPYVGQELAMVVLLPAEGRFDAFEASLTGERLEAILGALSRELVDLRLPRFEVRSRFSLKDTLDGLGMKKAFVFGDADFSGMNGNRDLYIGGVIHQSFVKVDEKGTEAAAATAVTMLAGGAPPKPIPVTVDRPFVFLVRDRTTGAVLFLGRVLDPK